MIPCHIRLDDVGTKNLNMEYFIERVLDAGHKLNLEVIPSDLSLLTADFLNRMQAQYPDQIEAHLHGYRHVNYERGGFKSEFSAARSYEEKRRDLRKGKNFLLDELGSLFFPVFCPPWDMIDADGLHALQDVGFAGVACKRRVANIPNGLVDLSFDINWLALTGSAPLPQAPSLVLPHQNWYIKPPETAKSQSETESYVSECKKWIKETHELRINIHVEKTTRNQSISALTTLLDCLQALQPLGVVTEIFSESVRRIRTTKAKVIA